MIDIKSAQFNQTAYKQFKAWLAIEWGNVEQLYDEDTRELPMPILAFINELLVGGMSFILYDKPATTRKTIWINALYIAPEYRGEGIASQLIMSAEEVFSKWRQSEMYVFTDKPDLYSKQGWHIINEENENFVLNKQLDVM